MIRTTTIIVSCIALADFIFHVAIGNNYGYFRDELYYIVAGQQHLALGYVDFPPFIAFLAFLDNAVAGDSLFSIHIISALAGAAAVFASAMIARELGGGARAQVLTAAATVFSASFAVSSIFSMDVWDMLWWTLLAYLLVRIIKSHNKDPKLWIIFGAVSGIGLMTKLTIAFFLIAILVSLALSSKRSYLKSKWPWLGAVVAILIFVPYLVWNSENSWATVDFFFHHGGLNGGGPLSFLGYQIIIAGILGLPLAIFGLFYYFRTPSRQFDILAIAFIILLIVFTITNAKPYFFMGAYPFAFAGGAVLIERISKRRRRFTWPTYLTGIILVGILLAPIYAPILLPQTYAKYYGGLTGAANGAAAQSGAGVFPQYLGDRFGWNTMTATVAQVYHNLNTTERTQACIFTLNYGEASALTILGRSYGLPPVISGHNNYYIWGPGKCSGDVLIIVGYFPSDVQSQFRTVYVAANITCSYCVPNEDNVPVIVGIGPYQTLQSEWTMLKHYD